MPTTIPHANVSRNRISSSDLDDVTLSKLKQLTRFDAQLLNSPSNSLNNDSSEAGFSEGTLRRDVDTELLELGHDFRFDRPIRGCGWHARERDQHGWFAWSGLDCDAWLDLTSPPADNRRLLCGVRHAASNEILKETRLSINGHYVKHQFKDNGPEVLLIADIDKSHVKSNQERVRIGLTVPSTITPDSGFEEHRRLGVAVSRIAFVPIEES